MKKCSVVVLLAVLSSSCSGPVVYLPAGYVEDGDARGRLGVSLERQNGRGYLKAGQLFEAPTAKPAPTTGQSIETATAQAKAAINAQGKFDLQQAAQSACRGVALDAGVDVGFSVTDVTDVKFLREFAPPTNQWCRPRGLNECCRTGANSLCGREVLVKLYEAEVIYATNASLGVGSGVDVELDCGVFNGGVKVDVSVRSGRTSYVTLKGWGVGEVADLRDVCDLVNAKGMPDCSVQPEDAGVPERDGGSVPRDCWGPEQLVPLCDPTEVQQSGVSRSNCAQRIFLERNSSSAEHSAQRFHEIVLTPEEVSQNWEFLPNATVSFRGNGCLTREAVDWSPAMLRYSVAVEGTGKYSSTCHTQNVVARKAQRIECK